MSSISDSSLPGVTPPVQESPGLEGGYWRSLAQLQGVEDPNLGAEFLPEQLDPMDGTSRRRFLQIMGASVAMASAAGCSKQHRHVVPYTRGIEGRTIGQLQTYATAMEVAGAAIGLLGQNFEGRPIRLDGNPGHPLNKGSVNAWATASILGLYDPDRSTTIKYKANPRTAIKDATWDDVKTEFRKLQADLGGKQGEGLRILSEATSSATMLGLKERLLAAMPKAQWITYEPVGRDNERLGTKLVFGSALRAHYDLSKAAVIVDIDADLLGSHPATLQYTRDFAANRNPEAALQNKGIYNRLYCVESNLSTTGGTADHRLAWRSFDIKTVIAALGSQVHAVLHNAKPTMQALGSPKADKFVAALAKDLVTNKGKCVLAVGFRQPPEVHAAVHDLNFMLGNVGSTVSYYAAPEGDGPTGYDALATLVKDMNGGKVSTLLMLGTNPVYSAPSDLKFAEALAKVSSTVHVGQYYDETAALCQWHLPQSHYLESWSDARSWNGVHSVVQPLIEPLHKTKSGTEIVSLFLGQSTKGYDLAVAAFEKLYGANATATWKKALQDGFVADSAWKPVAAKPATATASLMASLSTLMLNAPVRASTGAPTNIEAVFIPDTRLFDGRFSNNAWLQELPDFVTKLTWDNAVLLSYNTATSKNLKHGQMANVTLNGQTIKAPIYVQPGLADQSATLLMGFGRRAAGVVGGSAVGKVGTVGVDFNVLRRSSIMDIVPGLTLTPLNEWYEFASTMEHSQIDTTGLRERDKRSDILIRSDSLAHYKKDQTAIKHAVHELPMIKLFDNPLEQQVKGDYKWGMAIDLGKCTGCNACVIACQSENNIPVVGREQVINQREMHWLRIDRYFHGDSQNLEDVTLVHQPMMCVHCENAPCEQVCPVAATVHSADGTNDMVYNRCIGTRYCANNCPFKVRRFNFLNYHKQLDDEKNNVIRLVFNPEVTVRSRGVMESARTASSASGRPR